MMTAHCQKNFILILWIGLLALQAPFIASFAEAQQIDVVISPRAPYYTLAEDGAIGGIVGTRAVEAFAKTEIEANWRIVSFNRQLQLVEDDTGPVCGIGWFRNPDREKFAKFTQPIYQDKPLVALSRLDEAAVLKHSNLQTLMADPDLTKGMKLGFSYGIKVDRMIEELKPATLITDQSNIGMVRMLIGSRFDYMLLAPEEADHLMSTYSGGHLRVTTIQLRDLPPQNKRHIMCSLSVPDDAIEALNKSIAALGQ